LRRAESRHHFGAETYHAAGTPSRTKDKACADTDTSLEKSEHSYSEMPFVAAEPPYEYILGVILFSKTSRAFIASASSSFSPGITTTSAMNSTISLMYPTTNLS